MSNPKSPETTRRLIHLLGGAGALLMVPLGRSWSAAVAAAAFLYNALVAPALGWDRRYRRSGEPLLGGLATYPLAVLLLVLLFPTPVAAGGFAVLAAADPVAAFAGAGARTRLPWNGRKSLRGTLAGAAAGSVGAALVLAASGFPRPLVGGVCGGAAGAVAESLPLGPDDNLPLAFAAALAILPFA